MQKSSSQKALKVISIIMIVFGGLGIAGGLLTAIGGGAIGAAGVGDSASGALVAGGMLAVLGIAMLTGAAINLVIGIFGLRGANDPRKIGVFLILAVIGTVFAALNVIGTLLGGDAELSTMLSSLFGLALPVVCVILANNIKKENRL